MPTDSDSEKAPRRRRRRLRGWKGWVVKIAIVLASPALFLLLVEWGLRLAGYGRSTEFLLRWRGRGETLYVANREFCLQFVPQELSRPPEPIALAPKLADSAVRIFVLGGSAAAGDPESAFGFCRVLEALLHELAGGRSFEVVNAAVTAMNSHVARRIARDCAGHEPDAFIVYMGNNEVVGPYGPRTLPPNLYRSTRVIRAAIAARGSRIGQLLASLAKPEGGPRKKWLGMEAFIEQQIPFDDPRLKHCYGHFRANLEDIVDTALDAGAKVVLCTAPTNLRACAPFGSQHRPGLTEAQRARWQKLFDAGRALQQSARFAEALATYQSAAAIDDAYADLAFSMGQCAEQGGKPDAAAEHYRRARDLDTLRFRADSRINAAIRQAAGAAHSESVALLDLESALQQHADKGILGDGLLVDHVHLSFRGNVLAAVAAARTLGQLLPGLGLKVPTADGTGELAQRLRRRLLFDARAEFDIALTMYRRATRPPFVGQLGHEAQMAARRKRLIDLRQAVRRLGLDRSKEQYLAAVAAAPRDPVLLRRLGELLLTRKEAEQAVRHYEERLRAVPHCATTHEGLAVALACAGRADDAVEALTSADNPRALPQGLALARVATALIEHGKALESEPVCRRAIELDPQDAGALTNLGAATLEKGDPQAAAAYLERALKADPGSTDAMVNLANSFVKREKGTEALAWFRKAVEADPYHSTAHTGLGLQLARERKLAEAMKHLKRAIHLNPAFVPPYGLLALIYRSQGARGMAEQYVELATLFGPE